ncbi:hypothetical protein I7I50_07417 [Histoplasma capsulatum G186AR]|uniref:Uncharacterized protein n=1 Tax=Ajellomyces capsulatus TaxID=5037 RepID=A0A8H7YZK3_AJECA|nr:hypothetical protein I7I52_09511 [Histoplasma capsulatum]QSS68122.1 hypothetical protein I7I50_07417 [Histoplasma capsulatum G186AR]
MLTSPLWTALRMFDVRIIEFGFVNLFYSLFDLYLFPGVSSTFYGGRNRQANVQVSYYGKCLGKRQQTK